MDLIRAAVDAGPCKMSLQTRLPPQALAHADYVKELGLDLTSLQAPVEVFRGSAAEAARRFPRHFNIAISLLYAVRHELEIDITVFADPAIDQAIHRFHIDSDAGEFTLDSKHNYTAGFRASRIVAPSILAALRRLVDPVVVGS
jgi:aspartate dehydrogenase